MVILALILAIAAVEIILAALVIKTLWGASATHEPATRRALGTPRVSPSVTPFVTPGGTSAR